MVLREHRIMVMHRHESFLRKIKSESQAQHIVKARLTMGQALTIPPDARRSCHSGPTSRVTNRRPQ